MIQSIDWMKHHVEECCSKFIGSKMSRTTVYDVKVSIINSLKLLESELITNVNYDAISFEINPQDDTEILPANLYTHLIMNGIIANYDDVKDKTQYTVPETDINVYFRGCTLQFTPHTSLQTIKLKTPLKFIKATFTLKDNVCL